MAATTNYAKRSAKLAARMEQQVQQRIGISRHNINLVICGVPVAELCSPDLLRERFYRKRMSYNKKRSGAPLYHTYHFALVRFRFQGKDGGWYTALRCQTHDMDRGYCLSVTGFFSLKSA